MLRLASPLYFLCLLLVICFAPVPGSVETGTCVEVLAGYRGAQPGIILKDHGQRRGRDGKLLPRFEVQFEDEDMGSYHKWQLVPCTQLKQLPTQQLALIRRAQEALQETGLAQSAYSQAIESDPAATASTDRLRRASEEVLAVIEEWRPVFGEPPASMESSLAEGWAYLLQLQRSRCRLARDLHDFAEEARWLQVCLENSACIVDEDRRMCEANALNRLVILLRHHLHLPAAATEWYSRAVEMKLPFMEWPSEWHMPLITLPGLRSQPWWTGETRVGSLLEEHFDVIHEEFQQLAGGQAWTQDDYFLALSGEWSELNLYQAGQWTTLCNQMWRTCKLLRGLPEVTSHPPRQLAAVPYRPYETQVGIFKLAPGARLQPHTGPANYRLYCHLGLEVPVGPYIRVGPGPPRTWQQGKALCFDDSFVHEAWHEGNGDRYVLFVVFYHPDLGKQEL